jgi:AAA domain
MKWQPLNLTADEYAKPTEPPVILGLIYRGKRHALSGPPESAKTLLALAIGLEWYRAGLGRFALIDFEQGPPATRLLLEELGATEAELADVYYVEADAPPTSADINVMLPAGVTLTIVDAAAGVYDASGLDDNKRADVERFARTWIVPLWQAGCTTILLDHVVKNSETRGRYAIGSERKLGQVDVHLGLEAVTHISRGGHGLIRVTVHKDRPAHLQRPHPCELHLTSDPDTHRLTWETRPPTSGNTDAPNIAPAARKLLEALAAQDAPATGHALVDWIAATYGHGLSRETVSKHLNAFQREGVVECANPDAPVVVSKLWQLVPGVTDVTSHVTSQHGVTGVITRDRSHVTGVTDLLGEVTRNGHNGTPPDEITTDEAPEALLPAENEDTP